MEYNKFGMLKKNIYLKTKYLFKVKSVRFVKFKISNIQSKNGIQLVSLYPHTNENIH